MDPTFAVVAGGARLEAAWVSPQRPERPTIVMLHQALGSLSEWKSFPVRLASATGCGVFAYSRANHGRSETSLGPADPAYLQREGEVVLPELLQRIAVTRPVLFGHSDGASIGLIFAGAFPEHSAGLILEAPHVFVEERSVTGVGLTREAFLRGALRRRLARHHDDVDAAFRQWCDVWLDPAFRSWNIESYLSSIRCPALLVAGADDEYGSPAQLDAIRRRVRECDVLLLEHCGHSPHRERPEAILDATARFVQRIAGDGPA